MVDLDQNIVDPITPEQWLEFVEQLTDEKLANVLREQHSGDVVALMQQMAAYFQIHAFQLLDAEQAAEVLPELDEPDQTRLIENTPDSRMNEIASFLPTDDATDLISQLDDQQAQDILQQLPAIKRRQISELLKYDEDSAGGIMAKEVVSAPLTATVGEVIELLRKSPWRDEDLYNIFLVDDLGKLEGSVSIKDLVLALPSQLVAEIIDEEMVSIPSNLDQEEVVALFRRYDLVSAPVVNEDGKFVGRITHDDIMDVVDEEAREDLARMSGQEDIAPTERSLFRNIRYRLPWLLLGLVGGLVSATVISLFENELDKVTALVFFLPLVAAMGGNAGIQTSSVMVRGLATGEISYFGMGTRLLREAGIALLTGLACAIVIFILSWFWKNDLSLSIVISSSLLLVMLLSAITGAVVPLIMKKYGLDPALATGPFITMTNDILGLFVYLALASFVLFG